MDQKAIIAELEKINQSIFSCHKCLLSQTRHTPVPGQGHPQAKIIFVGEAPGFNEDQTGQPFCGPAGQVFDRLLNSVGLNRNQIFITNILKCRPPNNRDPQTNEINACTPYLDKQIELINPRLICPLGRHSMKYILGKYGFVDQVKPISQIHGQTFNLGNLFQQVTIIPFYHPAVASYNQNMLPILLKDFQILKNFSLLN